MRTVSIAVAATLAITLLAGPVFSQVRVFGVGNAASCSSYAFVGDSSRKALQTCSLALDLEAMGPDITAATYVNRGIIHMRLKMFANAAKDYDDAEEIKPRMAEVYLNRGALMIRQMQYRDAITQIDRGLALAPREPAKGYFNRALARERLQDFAGAYEDFRRAQTLDPQWDLPAKELTRYTVENRARS